jgi:hypothetical protein
MMNNAQMTGLSNDMRTCIDNCLTCYAACEETVGHCMQMGGAHAEHQHIALLEDCGTLCETSAKLMLRMSPLHPELCRMCADACDRCKESCERISRDDEVMRRCVEACESCAESCRRMSV